MVCRIVECLEEEEDEEEDVRPLDQLTIAHVEMEAIPNLCQPSETLSTTFPRVP